jgi:hypothetical protein
MGTSGISIIVASLNALAATGGFTVNYELYYVMKEVANDNNVS